MVVLMSCIKVLTEETARQTDGHIQIDEKTGAVQVHHLHNATSSTPPLVVMMMIEPVTHRPDHGTKTTPEMA